MPLPLLVGFQGSRPGVQLHNCLCVWAAIHVITWCALLLAGPCPDQVLTCIALGKGSYRHIFLLCSCAQGKQNTGSLQLWPVGRKYTLGGLAGGLLFIQLQICRRLFYPVPTSCNTTNVLHFPSFIISVPVSCWSPAFVILFVWNIVTP